MITLTRSPLSGLIGCKWSGTILTVLSSSGKNTEHIPVKKNEIKNLDDLAKSRERELKKLFYKRPSITFLSVCTGSMTKD